MLPDASQIPVGGGTQRRGAREAPKVGLTLESRKAAATGLSETLPMNEIEAFAAEMVELGGEYGYPPLVSWGKTLADQASMLDIGGMGKTLDEFLELIQGIQSVTGVQG